MAELDDWTAPAADDWIAPGVDDWVTPGPAKPKASPLAPLAAQFQVLRSPIEKLGRIAGAAGQAAKEAFGPEPIIEPPDSPRLGVLQPTPGVDEPGKRLLAMLARDLGGVGDLAGRVFGALTQGGTGAAAQMLREAGISDTKADTIMRDLNLAAQTLPMEPGLHAPVAREAARPNVSRETAPLAASAARIEPPPLNIPRPHVTAEFGTPEPQPGTTVHFGPEAVPVPPGGVEHAPEPIPEPVARNYQTGFDLETLTFGVRGPDGAFVRSGFETPEQAEGAARGMEPERGTPLERPQPKPEAAVQPEPQPEPAAPTPVERDDWVAPPEPSAAEKPGTPSSIDNAITYVNPADINVDPKTFQFRSEQDERGVSDRLKGITEWQPTLADPLILYRDENGQLWVADGHHRLDLANRLNEEGRGPGALPAFVLDAAQGYTPGKARLFAAYKNIANGHGTAVDAAKVLRESRVAGADIGLPQLPETAAVKQGKALSELSDDAFGMVVNGIVEPEHAAVVPEYFKDPTEQTAALSALAEFKPQNVTQARSMLADMKAAGMEHGTEVSLFGTDQMASSLIGERARVLDNALRTIRNTSRTFGTAAKGHDILAAAGNTLDRIANEKGKSENDRLIASIAADGNRKGPVSDALSAAARDLKSGKQLAGATADFLTQARKNLRRGSSGDVSPGPHSGGLRDTAPEDDQLGPALQRAPGEAPAGEEASLARGLVGEMRPSETFTAKEAALAKRVDAIASRMFPGARSRTYGRMRATDETGKAGQVYGAYYPAKLREGLAHVIAWSLESPDAIGTVRHEGIHYILRSGLLDDQERAVLADAVERQGWINDAIKRDYGHLPYAGQLEEATAEAFRRFRQGGIAEKLPGPIKAIFQKLDEFRRRIAAVARQIMGKGATADDIFTNIESGKIGRRAGEAERTEPPAIAAERPAVDQTEQGAQPVMPGAERAPEEEAAAAAKARRDANTVAARQQQSKMRTAKPQQEPGGLFDKGPDQGTLFQRPRDEEGATPIPEGASHLDNVSDAIADIAGKGATTEGRTLQNIVQRGAKAIKNLNLIEAYSIVPRSLAGLDGLSAKFLNAWQNRTTAASVNLDRLRATIAPNFLKLTDKAARDRVYGALELDRLYDNRRPVGDGPLEVYNTASPYARHTKPGDRYTITNPREIAAYHELVKLGDEGRQLHMESLAKREGWTKPIDLAAMAKEAQANKGNPEGKRLGRLIAVLHMAQQDMARPYFPMMRFGDHFIAVRPKPGVDAERLGGYPQLTWFETVERPTLQDVAGYGNQSKMFKTTASKVQDRIADLRNDFPEATHTIEHGDIIRTPQILRSLDIPALEKLMMLMERKVKDAEMAKILRRSPDESMDKDAARAEASENWARVHESLTDTLLDETYRELFAGYKRQASMTPGYSEDFGRAIGTHMHHLSRNAADMVHRDGIENAWQELQANHPHQAVRQYWKSWRARQEDPQSTLGNAANTVAQAGSVYALALNGATTSIIALHTPMMAAPVMSVGVGIGRTAAALGKGLAQAYRFARIDRQRGAFIDVDKLRATLPADEGTFLGKMEQEGHTHSIGAHDIEAINERQAGTWGSMRAPVLKAMQLVMSNISTVDQANRIGTALAAYRIGKSPLLLAKAAEPLMEHNALFRDMVEREGLTPESYGRFMVSHAAGAWGKENRAPIMTGPLGTLMFTLHGFQTRYLAANFNLWKNMGPEGKIAGAWMMAGLWFGAGGAGLPLTQDIANGADHIWKFLTKHDPMIMTRVRALLADSGMGKIGAEIAMRGPLGYLLGIDLTDRIGFGDILSREMSGSDVLGTVPSMLLGRLNAAWLREQSGQGTGAALTELLPAGLRNPARAAVEAGQGLKTQKGKILEGPARIGAGDLARQAIGFRSLAQQRDYERQDYVYRAKRAHGSVPHNPIPPRETP